VSPRSPCPQPRDKTFDKIRTRVRELFPTVKRVGVRPISQTQLVMETELIDGTVVTAARMSEGLLYYLAFAVLPRLAPSPVVLIEEPENDLHPARIGEVIGALRAHSSATGTQILRSTHSPLAINELSPDEVTVLTRPSTQKGTQAVPIRQTHNFAERSGGYSLGELGLA